MSPSIGTLPQSLWGRVTCFTIEVGNSSSNSKTKNITNYTHQEGNIYNGTFVNSALFPWCLDLLHGCVGQSACSKEMIRHAVHMLLFII